MALRLRESTVLLTGASAGIGRELAQLLGPKCTRLILVARRVEKLAELKTELLKKTPALDVVLEPCDLGDLPAVHALCAKLDGDGRTIDVLVNNAGVGDLGLYERADLKKTLAMVDLNISSLLILTRHFVAGMVARGHGGVLNISSSYGLQWTPGMSAYIGTKHFVTGFTESLRSDLAGTGVVVTQSCPGPVKSEFASNIGNFTGRDVPRIVEIDADTCARQTLAAFERGRALIIPGWTIWFLIMLGAWTPRFMLRWLMYPLGRALRKTQLAAPAASPPQLK